MLNCSGGNNMAAPYEGKEQELRPSVSSGEKGNGNNGQLHYCSGNNRATPYGNKGQGVRPNVSSSNTGKCN